MKLHLNQKLYKQAVQYTAEQIGLPEIFIEKDYWLTLVLKAIFNDSIGHQVVFKGGTSLSKCFDLVERFSEDIDLAILKSPTDSSNQLTSRLKTISKIVSDIIPEIEVEGLTRKMGMNRKTVHT
jgi:predicted nucleotidyltransferase component of viral defense system